MTHSPPIPAGNQSPYPIQEPPHVYQPSSEPRAETRAGPTVSGISVLTALAIGAGTVLTGVAALLFLRDPSKKKSKSKRRRKT